MPFNIPILLTWLRIVLIPLLIGIYYVPEPWASLQERNLIATLLLHILLRYLDKQQGIAPCNE